MTKLEKLNLLIKNGVFAVIRMTDTSKVLKVVEAISKGGVKNIEITMTVPNAVEIITELTKNFREEIITGAGTVLNAETAEEVLTAGAKFVVSPVFNPKTVEVCKSKNSIVVPGCYTPSEILAGHNAGADMVKVFPATSLGPKYFQDVLAVFPFIKLMPTGGVTIENIDKWIEAGAAAIALGSNLLDKKAIAENRFEVLTEKAKQLVDVFNSAREKFKK